LDPEVMQVIQGGQEVCEEVLRNKTDVIIFTGSPQKGVLVARAAADFLTPCILELGGQNPCIVDKSSDLQSAAYNLVNGRCMVSGQVCLAPEYILVEKEVCDKLVNELKKVHDFFFESKPKESESFCRIINDFHSERLSKLCETHEGKVIYGGDYDKKEKYIAPTLVTFDSIEVLSKSPLAESEIFGPIQYLAPYSSLDEAINYINSKDKPLALYYFGFNKSNKERILNNTSSGAFVINDTVMHFVNSSLPFGGVGKSGYGACHGKYGFDNLSHLKPVFDTTGKIVAMRYPPFNNRNKKLLGWAIANLTFPQSKALKTVLAIVGVLALLYWRNVFLKYIF